jgi:choline dehydrogenase-like flavoprotein
MAEKVDVVIVGAGAAASVYAAVLAEAGKEGIFTARRFRRDV